MVTKVTFKKKTAGFNKLLFTRLGLGETALLALCSRGVVQRKYPATLIVGHFKKKGFYYFLGNSRAACAAANLAMGTRNGEQLT
jgi:hypothetical protein